MKNFDIRKVPADQIPLDLLLLADPSEQLINSYLPNSECYAAREGDQIVGVCVLKMHSSSTVEIKNIAMYPDCQGTGVGTKLLRHTINQASLNGTKKILVKTGTFGYPPTFYQRLGFRVVAVEQDYFLTTYNEPLFESGIQHQDRLVLELCL
mgnify:CR=1 FL=1